MNKLGFAIRLASQGTLNAILCNQGAWTNKVVDIREYLKLFNGLQDTDNIVAFTSYDEEGCFLTLLRAIPGRVGDFLSSWIYIPAAVQIEGYQVVQAYEFAKEILMQSNLHNCKFEIEEFFNREYPIKPLYANYTPSSGQNFGVRVVGENSLTELLGNYRYQSVYSDYRAIFFMDETCEVTVAREYAQQFKDLTNIPLRSSAVMAPPPPAELESLGAGTHLILANGRVFNQPLTTEIGAQVEIRLVRNGFEMIPFTITIASEMQQLQVKGYPVNWKKTIRRSSFLIHGEQGEEIDDVRIVIDGKELTATGLIISETAGRNINVCVSAPGYYEYQGVCNVIDSCPEIILRKDASLCEQEENNQKKKLLIYILSGIAGLLIVFLAIKGYEFMEDYLNSDAPHDETAALSVEYTIHDAAQYLDSHKVWDKEELGQYSQLAHLYDDMNQFNLDALMGMPYDELREASKAFQTLCTYVRTAQNENRKLQYGQHNPTYNKQSETRINIEEYIQWLEQDTIPLPTNPTIDSGLQQKPIQTP